MADDAPTPEQMAELQEQLATFSVDEFVVSAATTLASLAYAKLERVELAEAKKAIDAFQSLLPHVEGPLQADLQQALTQLQVAYAAAVSG